MTEIHVERGYKKNIIFVFICIGIIVVSLVREPIIIGDGREYLAMTIGFKNHFTPNLTIEDNEERRALELKNNISFPLENDLAGYFEALNGEQYSYHFWLYSLISVVPYILLDLLDINQLKVFQFTNAILLVFLLYKINKNNYVNEKQRVWLLLTTILSPVLLYIPWSHPEVFSFTLLFIGLLEYLENKRISAIIYTALASLQNPGISIVTLVILFIELFENKKITKQLVAMTSCSLIVFIPYIFYWMHFRKFNLITSSGSASIELISINKILSLFFDPNFGLFVYLPVLGGILGYLLIKQNLKAIIGVVTLLVIAFICATQYNWNSGMMYINRYSFWMIPVLLIVTLDFIKQLNRKNFIILNIFYVITSGLITLYCLKEYDVSNNTKFSFLANTILNKAPAFYNPDYEIFVERSTGQEYYSINEALPVYLYNEKGMVKALTNPENLRYENGKTNILSSFDKLYTVRTTNENEDIFTDSYTVGFVTGYFPKEYDLEGKIFRWTTEESLLMINRLENMSTTLNIEIASFYQNKSATIYFNNEKIFEGIIDTSRMRLNIPIKVINGDNFLRIKASEYHVPSKVLENNNDNRKLSFVIYSIGLVD